MDRKKLVGEVAARHGIRLDEDDPAFVMATIAELAFRDAQSEFVSAIRLEMAEFARTADEVQATVGAKWGSALAEAMRQARRLREPKRSVSYIVGGLLVAIGFVAGRFSAL